jgi:type I restriction enzyme R subunit
MTLERQARVEIDEQLSQAGWVVQDYRARDLRGKQGVAVREFPLSSGEADYLLVVRNEAGAMEAAGVIEAKRPGTTLSGVHEQSARYQSGRPVRQEPISFARSPLPFAYEATDNEIWFTNELEPEARARQVKQYHRPETLARWLKEAPAGTVPGTNDLFCSRLRRMPPLPRVGLWDCQYEAITNLERSLAENRPRALIQMATGSGKTYMAVSEVYRLIKYGGARRVLFLVDRINLGKQALNEFQQYVTPDTGSKFTELYNVQLLTDNQLDPVADVYITTVQRLYSILTGQPEPEGLSDEDSLFEREDAAEGTQPKEVSYNPRLPIEYFDMIFIDECHRSIYGEWRPVLEYFDAFLTGLTATPDARAFAFFQRNLVMEYLTAQAVADGVNVDHRVYRIRTTITEEGSSIEKGELVIQRHRQTRRIRYEILEDKLEYDGPQLDRDVVAEDQIRTVLMTYRDALFTTLFPGRTVVPKTLIFAKDDSHAEDITRIAREVFASRNEFVKKITYRVTGARPDDLIRQFRNSYYPRIAVTVDMIATGTDVKPLEVVLFMRSVKSRNFYEQMKGRGCRVIRDEEFQSVTPDARTKTHFVLVDAVGVTERLKSDNPPLERRPYIKFADLMAMVARGEADEDALITLAGRLGRLAKRLTADETRQVIENTGGDLAALAQRLVAATDFDAWVARAQQETGMEDPGSQAILQAAQTLKQEAAQPFRDEALRTLLLRAHERDEQVIDDHSIDEVREARWSQQTEEQARQVVTSFYAEMEQRSDEIAAFEQAFSQPRSDPRALYRQLRQLADSITPPGVNSNQVTERVWQAYQVLDASRVRERGTDRPPDTDLIALLRYTKQRETDNTALLEPYREAVARNFAAWLAEKERTRGRPFTPEQRRWLEWMCNRIARGLGIDETDFDFEPFLNDGGRIGARRVFGSELATIMQELNERLVA